MQKQTEWKRKTDRYVHSIKTIVLPITTLFCVAIIFHCRVWYRAISLRCACIQSSGIILIPLATFVPNFVSFVASIAELAHGEELHTHSLTQLI